MARLSLLPFADFDSADDADLMVDSSTFASCPTADPRLIKLDGDHSTDHVGVRANHASTQFMENLKCRFIASDSKLPLELRGRHTGRHAGHKIGSPEPRKQRGMAVLHDCSRRESSLLAALTAPEDLWARRDARGVCHGLTRRAGEAVGPTDLFQVSRAGGIVRKEPLKLWQTGREWQIEHSFTLPVVVWCVNRISMVYSRRSRLRMG